MGNIDHPLHYTQKSHGVECICITEHLDFCRGNAFKYVWRHRDKGNPVEDLQKALWYMRRFCQSGSMRIVRVPRTIKMYMELVKTDPFYSVLRSIIYEPYSSMERIDDLIRKEQGE